MNQKHSRKLIVAVCLQKIVLEIIHGTDVFPQFLITKLKTGTASFFFIFQNDKKEHSRIQHCHGAQRRNLLETNSLAS